MVAASHARTLFRQAPSRLDCGSPARRRRRSQPREGGIPSLAGGWPLQQSRAACSAWSCSFILASLKPRIQIFPCVSPGPRPRGSRAPSAENLRRRMKPRGTRRGGGCAQPLTYQRSRAPRENLTPLAPCGSTAAPRIRPFRASPASWDRASPALRGRNIQRDRVVDRIEDLKAEAVLLEAQPRFRLGRARRHSSRRCACASAGRRRSA